MAKSAATSKPLHTMVKFKSDRQKEKLLWLLHTRKPFRRNCAMNERYGRVRWDREPGEEAFDRPGDEGR